MRFELRSEKLAELLQRFDDQRTSDTLRSAFATLHSTGSTARMTDGSIRIVSQFGLLHMWRAAAVQDRLSR
jgi:hypothetical protein